MHYVYHIPERLKIGVTDNLERRMEQHKWTGPYQVMEQHLDGWHAGDREWELQDQHGYPRDKFHYMVSVMNASSAGKIGGTISKPTLTFEQRSAHNLANVNKPTRKEQWKNAAANSRIKVECPHCNKTGSKNVDHSKHFDNCRFNPNDLEMVRFNQKVLEYVQSHSKLNTANTFNIHRSVLKKIIEHFE